MPDINEFSAVPRRALHLFYVLDTSGSMSNAPIATLNMAMTETVEALKDLAKKNSDAQLKISVLEFNTSCKWTQSGGPEDVEDFFWQDLEAGGMTYMGAALKELDSKLSRNAFLRSMTGNYLPVIIFMTDGFANDDYAGPLAKIRENRWFAKSTKIGFAIGENPDVNMISEIVGSPEAVIQTTDLDKFARMIRFASVTASMLAGTSRTSSNDISGSSIVSSISSDEPDLDVGGWGAEPTPALGGSAYSTDFQSTAGSDSSSDWDDVDAW